MAHKIKLLDRAGRVFEEEVSLRISDPEAILFAEKIYLPTKKADVYRECRFDVAPLPYLQTLTGN